MDEETRKKDKRNCKYYECKEGRYFCNFLAGGLQCFKVCNMFIDIEDVK